MRAKILVIDDEKDFIDLITHSLGEVGFEIVGARGGIQGLHQARRHLPDIIVLDMGLPDIIESLMVCFGIPEICVSGYGIRHGALLAVPRPTAPALSPVATTDSDLV